MMTKKKPFDAVEESRRWKEETSRALNSMTRTERLEHFKKLQARIREKQRPAPVAREDETRYRADG